MKIRQLYIYMVTLFMAMGTTQALSQEFRLYIAGNGITKAGKVSGEGIVGDVYYDGDKTLTLTNATITTTATDINDDASICIKNESIDGLVIKLDGDNKLVSRHSSAIVNKASMTVMGKGALVVEGAVTEKGCCGILNWKKLTVKDCSLTAVADIGIAGGDLCFDNVTVRATGSTAGSILGYEQIELLGCKLTAPVGATFGSYVSFNGSTFNAVMMGTDVVMEEVGIEPGIETYPLYVGGMQIDNVNATNITGEWLQSGKVKYNAITNTLILDNATIIRQGNKLNEYDSGICNKGIGSLTIQLIGENKITTEEHFPIANMGDNGMTITGEGSLTVKGKSYGLYSEGKLTITGGCVVEANGDVAIGGSSGTTDVLTVSQAIVRATGPKGSIRDFTLIELKEEQIVSPEGAVVGTYTFDGKQKQAVMLNGEIVKEEVVIQPVEVYHLFVAGTQVTSGNCNLLSTIGMIDGHVAYDPETKTLTLDNAEINALGDNTGICNMGIDDLKIVVKGDCRISTEKRYAAIDIYKPTVIEGDGRLVLSAENSCALYLNASSVTIRNCEVDATGSWAIAGPDGESGEHLTIEKATVKALGSGMYGSICDIAAMTLADCRIVTPEGAQYDAEKKGVVLHDELVKEQIVIKPMPEGIGTMATDDGMVAGVYNVAGHKLNSPQGGVNIIKMDNGMTRKVICK